MSTGASDRQAESGVTPSNPSAAYGEALTKYVLTRTEAALYQASLLSQEFIRAGLGPEEIIALHAEAIRDSLTGLSFREQASAATDGLQFLLEVMIAYGINHREFLELRVKERAREADQFRQRADEAERALRERADLLQRVVHELRTPLAVVKGNLQMARRALARGQFDQLEHMAAQALEAVSRLARMTQSLVEASRGEAALVELAPQDLRAVVTMAYGWFMAAGDAAAKDIALTFADCSEPLPVLGDVDALASVISNLVSNAIRYTPKGGQVVLRCGATADWVWAEVADTGIGMTPEARSHIFELFYRAPEASALERQGLGLGLALVRQLIAAHNGRVEVKSEPGRGSVFRVLLPRYHGDPGVIGDPGDPSATEAGRVPAPPATPGGSGEPGSA